MINLIKTKLTFTDKIEALRFHLLALFTEENLDVSLADINVAVEIYINGYNKDLFTSCVDKGYYKSEQTVRNSVAKMTKCKILLKSKNNRTINPAYLPATKENDFVFNYHVQYNKNVNQEQI